MGRGPPGGRKQRPRAPGRCSGPRPARQSQCEPSAPQQNTAAFIQVGGGGEHRGRAKLYCRHWSWATSSVVLLTFGNIDGWFPMRLYTGDSWLQQGAVMTEPKSVRVRHGVSWYVWTLTLSHSSLCTRIGEVVVPPGLITPLLCSQPALDSERHLNRSHVGSMHNGSFNIFSHFYFPELNRVDLLWNVEALCLISLCRLEMGTVWVL